MNLILIRHAKTEKTSFTGQDVDRKLTEKGLLQAMKLNDIISEYNLNNYDVWCSVAVRTKQTLSCFDKNFPTKNIAFKNELYMATGIQIRNLIFNTDTDKDLLIIGHNNGISEIASYFTGEDIHLNTATFVHITFDNMTRKGWSADIGRIKKIVNTIY